MSNRMRDVPGVPTRLQLDTELRSLLLSLRENVRALRGFTTEGLGAFGSGSLGGSGSGVSGLDPSIVPGGEGGPPDLTPPPTPTGVVVGSGIGFVSIKHDAPLFLAGHGYGRTMVYGAKRSGVEPDPTFDDAVLVHEFIGQVGTFGSDPATEWHIWVTWKTVDGIESTVPSGGTNGHETTTAQDVTLLLTALSKQISASQLAGDLSTTIKVFEPFISYDFTASASGWFAGGTATLTPGATAASVTSAGTDPIINSPAGLTIAGTPYDKVRARVKRTAGAGWDGTVYYATAGHGYDAGYRKTIANPPLAIGEWAILEWDMADLTAGGADWTSSTITQFRLDLGNSAADAFDIDWIAVGRRAPGVTSARVGDLEVSVQTEATARAAADGSLFAQYTVKIDNAGSVAGYGLASTAVNGTPTSAFYVRADQFAAMPPVNFSQESTPTGTIVGQLWFKPSTKETRTWDGDSWEPFALAVPFVVQTTPATVNGVVIPAGTYIDAAYIKNLTAMVARLGTLWVTDAMVQSMAVDKLLAGTIATGQYIRSSNYVAGLAGFNIPSSGLTELNDTVIRGTVYAAAGAIGGIVIASSFVRSTNYVAGTSGFKIAANGNFEVRNGDSTRVFDITATGAGVVLKIGSALEILADGTATFAGALSAATGSFAGSLDAATGTIGTLTLAAGGHIKAGQTAYNVGTGFWLGLVSGVTKFSIGSSTSNLLWDGTTLFLNGIDLGAFSASISGGVIEADGPAGTFDYGSRTCTATGGKTPYTYFWAITKAAAAGGMVAVTAGQGTATATFGGTGDNQTNAGTCACFVRDANGRVSFATVYVEGTHADGGGGGSGE